MVHRVREIFSHTNSLPSARIAEHADTSPFTGLDSASQTETKFKAESAPLSQAAGEDGHHVFDQPEAATETDKAVEGSNTSAHNARLSRSHSACLSWSLSC